MTKSTKPRPQPQPRSVGSFPDPRTGAIIVVYAKKGESMNDAIARVKRRHKA